MWWYKESECDADCQSCPLNQSKKVFSFLTNQEKVDILVIGQSPGKNEVAAGRPFIGESGHLINPILTQYATDVAYINTISCRPLDKEKQIDRMPTSAEVKCCRGRLDKDIEYIINTHKPKLVLVFGAVAKKEIVRLLKSGKYPQINFHYLEHPAHILRNRHMEGKFVTGLHNILKSTFSRSDIDDIIKSFVTYDDSLEEQFLDDVVKSRNLGVDIETNKLNMFDLTFIIGTAAVSCDDRTYFFDGRHRDLRECSVLMNVLKNPKVQKVFADVMFDVVSFRACGIQVFHFSDLFPLAFLYDNTFLEYDLEAITMRYFPELASYKSRFHSLVIDNNYLDVDTKDLMIYNCFDAFVTRKTHNYLYDKLDAKARLAFDKITVRMLPALVSMKIAGMKVDVDLLNKYVTEFEIKYTELAKFLKEKYGLDNINSTPQVSKWLFQELKLKPIKFNKPTQAQKAKGIRRGNPSTDKEVIEALASQVPDVRKLYEARRVANLLNYTLPSIKDGLDGENIVHPRYKHYGIQSFRLSCLSPNLQGISRDKTGLDFLDKYPIRRLFIARYPDSYIVEFDYSQQEVRIVAELSRDQGLMDAFRRGDDIHRFVASILFRKPQKDISEFERQIAKSCVFGAIFGGGAREMSIKLRIKEDDAQAYLDEFFKLFKGVKSYIERQHNIVVNKHVITTILGQPRKFIIHQNNINDCKREGANHTIQAVGGGITFLAISTIFDKFITDNVPADELFLMHTIHDSTMTEARVHQLKYVIETVPAIMSSIPKKLGFTIDFPVEVKVGKRWGEALDVNQILNQEVMK